MRLEFSALALALVMGLCACSATVGGGDNPTTFGEQKPGPIGPYSLMVTEPYESSIYNRFLKPIGQSEGDVDFVYRPQQTTTIRLDYSSASPSGCGDLRSGQVDVYWVQYVPGSESVVEQTIWVPVGYSFTAKGGQKGALRARFKNLGGCSYLDYSMVARRLN